MEKLPLEITEHKLISGLPIDSQLQCREVCKTWRDLVPKPRMGLLYGVSHKTETEFKAEFYFSEQNHNKDSTNHVDEQLRCIGTLTLDQTIVVPVLKSFIVGSCNGLVCYGLIYRGYPAQTKIHICNPVTGEHIQLPGTSNVWNLAIGFGYNRSSKEYKVVMLWDNCRDVQVYTLLQGVSDSEWRCKDYSSDNYHLSAMIAQPAMGVHVGGELYWINKYKYTSEPKNVVSFDLEYERFELLPYVPSFESDTNHVGHVGLMALGENLCFPEVVPSKGITIWELTFEKNVTCRCRRWVMKFSISLEHYSWFEPSALRKGDKCFLWHNVVLSCYDPAEPNALRKLDETLKKFIGDSTHSVYTTNQAIPHVNSLVSLKAIMGRGLKRK